MRVIENIVLLLRVLVLPPRVPYFYLRAHRIARREGDRFSLVASIRPDDLVPLLGLSRGRRHVVELGTGAAWAAIMLALADSNRYVISYDPVTHSSRDRYLALVGPETRSRIDLRAERAEHGPRNGDQSVDFLFIDIGGHSRADTRAAFLAWRRALAPGALVAFHDYGNEFPGVPMAVAQLGLEGRLHGRALFVCPASAS